MAGKSSSRPRGEKRWSAPAALLTSTIRKSAATSTISVSLPSVWHTTGRPMSRSRPIRLPGKKQNTRTMNDKEEGKMAVNPKAIKVLNKVLDAGFTDEKAIAAMTIDDILNMQGITVADIGIINELQKSIKANKVISF